MIAIAPFPFKHIYVPNWYSCCKPCRPLQINFLFIVHRPQLLYKLYGLQEVQRCQYVHYQVCTKFTFVLFLQPKRWRRHRYKLKMFLVHLLWLEGCQFLDGNGHRLPICKIWEEDRKQRILLEYSNYKSKNLRRISGTPRPSLLHCKNMMQAGVDY